eukprot:801341-Pyramimonas_sp.AAC.1
MRYGIWDMGHGPWGASEKVEGRKAGISARDMGTRTYSLLREGCGGGRWNEDARRGKEEAEEGSAGGNRQQ